MDDDVDDIIEALRKRYGDTWARGEDDNLRFSVDAAGMLDDVDGAHLIGEPELNDDGVTFTLWVDAPIPDLLNADQIAYDVFARISEMVFFAERRIEAKSVRYRFVTGSASHGHAGTLVLAGPHAADFADRHRTRLTGGVRYQA